MSELQQLPPSSKAAIFGNDLKRRRVEMGWSVTDAARFAGVHRNSLNNYETNKTTPDFITALVLCRLYKLDPWSYYPTE